VRREGRLHRRRSGHRQRRIDPDGLHQAVPERAPEVVPLAGGRQVQPPDEGRQRTDVQGSGVEVAAPTDPLEQSRQPGRELRDVLAHGTGENEVVRGASHLVQARLFPRTSIRLPGVLASDPRPNVAARVPSPATDAQAPCLPRWPADRRRAVRARRGPGCVGPVLGSSGTRVCRSDRRRTRESSSPGPPAVAWARPSTRGPRGGAAARPAGIPAGGTPPAAARCRAHAAMLDRRLDLGRRQMTSLGEDGGSHGPSVRCFVTQAPAPCARASAMTGSGS